MKPWIIILVGVLALLWNAGGAFDYVMTQTKNEAYLSQFTAEERAYFDSFPAWVQGCWATAVWSAVLGSLLLIFRSGLSVAVYTVSIIAMLVTFTHNFFLAETKMHEMVGQEAIYFTALIVVVAVALWLYARWLKTKGAIS
ncbi:hypothetical protein [uncultured Litoreibacter sp.]|uniref:hypothetical protein n=1 Tax=uncultured Litoreibacter sp. TaxID=1392394 RepID=UPI00261B7E83|nr:hypothetical protein [uncultured Litoreibacter sp.]